MTNMGAKENPSRVEIGYLEKSKPFKLESRFFPSKVGGRPAWLDLKNISIDVSCEVCSKPCIFLCQLYAPVELEAAYHRTVYIFVCRNPECCQTNKSNNFKVFRCQLPQVNEYYATEEPTDQPDWHPESTIDRYNLTCIVCGCLGSYRCSKCKNVNYCSKEHQVLDWKAGHGETCGLESNHSSCVSLLFPEFEILTEPEDLDNDDDDDKEESTTGKTEKSEKDCMDEYNRLLEQGKAGTLKEVPPEMLEEFACGVKKDKYLENFKERLRYHPDQVIRYDRGGEPLFVTTPDSDKLAVPDCEYCQGPREFEFQVLSTLLSYLNVDSLDKSIDWGTLLIYTCKNNCGGSPSYKKEILVKQDIL